MGIKTGIFLYTEGTPNGLKANIAMEELGLEYEYKALDLPGLEQKQPWFLEINPNGRIPALTDKDENGQQVKIWESGAILQYLVARYDKDHKISYPYDTKEHWETTSWLMFQVSGIGPMQGQANHFARFADAKYPYSLNRYVNETRRLYRVIETALAKSPHGFLVGDRLTVADIAIWPWLTAYKFSGIASIDEFPLVQEYLFRLLKRPGFEKGRNIPTPHMYLQLNEMTEEQLWEIGQSKSKWIQDFMKELEK